jgi:hypothetical protein
MLSLYRRVTVLAARRAAAAWPVALSLVAYAIIIYVGVLLTAPLGIVGGFLVGFAIAACWSSYLELISQAVAGSKIRVRWDDFKRSFGVRLWDVVSVMFAFWIIGLVTGPLEKGQNGEAIAAILGFAMAFFFNAVPELLYLGHSRSFALLMDSAKFVMAHPVVWLLPNLVFAAIALGASGNLAIHHPAEILILFGTTFSSPAGPLLILARLPPWSWPIVLAGLHFVMVFRGVLYTELTSGGGNARLRAFQAKLRG